MEDQSQNILGLIPAFNEEDRIGHVLLTAVQYMDVVVIDDGSNDQTASVAEDAGAVVIKQVPNQGKGSALLMGFRYALEQGVQAVITLDADGQHDPHEIPKFVQAYELNQADLIIGSRDFSQMPPVRRMANTLGRLTFSWALRQSVVDNQSGYRLISRRLMEAMLESGESGFEFEVEMVVVCVQNNFRLEWVPIRTIYAGERSHIQPLKHLVHFLRMVRKTRGLTRRR